LLSAKEKGELGKTSPLAIGFESHPSHCHVENSQRQALSCLLITFNVVVSPLDIYRQFNLKALESFENGKLGAFRRNHSKKFKPLIAMAIDVKHDALRVQLLV